MAKNKKRKLTTAGRKPARNHVESGRNISKSQQATKHNSKTPTTPPTIKPTIPLFAGDNVLLIGEGDFSFAHSLPNLPPRHRPAHIHATTLETHDVLLAKHPQSEAYITALREAGHGVSYEVDATRLEKYKDVKREGGWDRIVFNFPHVGGRSTDVNRQVRYNQELLVAFFKSAMPLLRRGVLPAKSEETEPAAGEWEADEEDGYESGSDVPPEDTGEAAADNPKATDIESAADAAMRKVGTITVTLFDGSPYMLWNIKDLARHVGLRIERSFAFQAAAYPGYKHARTLGNLHGKGRDSEGKGQTGDEAIGAWRGEERAARSYVFALPFERKRRNFQRKRKRDSDDEEPNTGDGE